MSQITSKVTPFNQFTVTPECSLGGAPTQANGVVFDDIFSSAMLQSNGNGGPGMSNGNGGGGGGGSGKS